MNSGLYPAFVSIIRGATLLHNEIVLLSEILSYLRQLTYAKRRRILGNRLSYGHFLLWPLTAPSVVHLIACVSSGSHLPGLSGDAQLPLSPLQRFAIFHLFIAIKTQLFSFVNLFLGQNRYAPRRNSSEGTKRSRSDQKYASGKNSRTALIAGTYADRSKNTGQTTACTTQNTNVPAA